MRIIRFLIWLFPLIALMFVDHTDAASDLLHQVKIRKLKRGTWPPIQFKPDDPKAGPRIWPRPHPGGQPTSEVYDWAAQWILETGRDPGSIRSIREAWAEVPTQFPGYISKASNEYADKQWERFRRQVRRRLEKRT